MSDNKRNENQNAEEMQALFDLLQRMEQRDEARRAYAFSHPEAADLITPEDEEEPRQFQIDSFVPVGMSDYDVSELLITTEENEAPHFVADDTAWETDGVAPRPSVRRNPFAALWTGFRDNLPKKGDAPRTKARKWGFLTSLLVMLVALVYLAVDLLLIPAQNTKLKNELIELYHPEDSQVVVSEEDDQYPEKMLASFRDLYDRNDEVRGWISYHADNSKDFLNIEYPIVYSGDNEKYLKKDFDGNKNRNGTLFFDKANHLESYKDKNRSLIVYGHNMASGQMFAGLNKFLGSVSNARSAATLTLSTLYRQDEYKVFAVILTDESDTRVGRYFNTRRTTFTSDSDFLQYIDEMRARSMFDYPVDVQGSDEILVLSTCTGKTSAHVKDGRLVVVARRVRDGETASVDTAKIVKNDDVIMPYYWYMNQKLTPHKYYLEEGLDYGDVPDEPNGSTQHTGRVESTTTTETVDGEDTTTADGDGTTATTADDDDTTTRRPTTGTTTGTKPTTGTTKPTEGTDPTEEPKPTESTDAGDATEPTDTTAPTTEPTEPTTEPTESTTEATTEATTTTTTEATTEPTTEPTTTE